MYHTYSGDWQREINPGRSSVPGTLGAGIAMALPRASALFADKSRGGSRGLNEPIEGRAFARQNRIRRLLMKPAVRCEAMRRGEPSPRHAGPKMVTGRG